MSGAAGAVATAGEPRYLRFMSAETALEQALDDGRFTYLMFREAVAAALELYDQDGRPVTHDAAGRVVAIQGLYSGLLVRLGDHTSFVSPNPRAVGLPAPPLPDSTDFIEVRARLENRSGLMSAMQRALDAVRGRDSVRAPDAVPNRPASNALSYAAPPSAAVLVQPVPVPALTPLAVANASSSAPERGLVRVFFATSSRAIVAPDDGLELLIREAARADEIRVTGFTDSTGAPATNQALANARADAVVQILLRRGIARERIFTSAIAAGGFIGDNASDRGRALNRRAEIVLLQRGLPLLLGQRRALP